MMVHALKTAASAALIFSGLVSISHASNLVQLDKKPASKTIVAIGTVPEPKKVPLDLGPLRTGEPKLPGGVLTRQERMELRARRALERQRQVTRASRKRVTRRSAGPTKKRRIQPPSYDGEVEVALDENGQPTME